MRRLEGRTLVVTGAADGIGRALAHVFAGAGGRLVLADVQGESAAALAHDLRRAGAQALSVEADVADEAAPQTILSAALREFGAAHVLVNNAGVAAPGRSMAALGPDDWRWVIDVNLLGPVRMIDAFLPSLVRAEEAHIVNVASITAFDPGPYNAPYCASKAALAAMSESLADELAIEAAHVGVTIVCPGPVRTSIARSEERRPSAYGAPRAPAAMPDPMKQRLAQAAAEALAPEEVAEAVLNAVSRRARFVFTHENAHARAMRRIKAAFGDAESGLV
ncbi:MAG: SDR family NAD(P)-dependent oxidoreductase [Hyphomonadaceae bacterium]